MPSRLVRSRQISLLGGPPGVIARGGLRQMPRARSCGRYAYYGSIEDLPRPNRDAGRFAETLV